jgi:hypothetical protein
MYGIINTERKKEVTTMKDLFKRNKSNSTTKTYEVYWVDVVVSNASGKVATFTDEELAREYAEFKNKTSTDPDIYYYVG